MDDHSVHTIPNYHPTKKDVLPKTLVQIILAADWLVWHSSMFLHPQRRPLPFLLSLSFFDDLGSKLVLVSSATYCIVYIAAILKQIIELAQSGYCSEHRVKKLWTTSAFGCIAVASGTDVTTSATEVVK